MTEQMLIVEYNTTADVLTELRINHAGPFDVTTSKGMGFAIAARAEVRGHRVALEKLRIELRAPSVERIRLIDSEAKLITAELLKIEEPLNAIIKAEENRKDDEKTAKVRAEVNRVSTIASRISGIRNRVSSMASQPAATVREELEMLTALELDPADFDEFMPNAINTLLDTRAMLNVALVARIAYEEEQAAQATPLQVGVARLKESEISRQDGHAHAGGDARQSLEAEVFSLESDREEPHEAASFHQVGGGRMARTVKSQGKTGRTAAANARS